jgi:hypothetical protein
MGEVYRARDATSLIAFPTSVSSVADQASLITKGDTGDLDQTLAPEGRASSSARRVPAMETCGVPGGMEAMRGRSPPASPLMSGRCSLQTVSESLSFQTVAVSAASG